MDIDCGMGQCQLQTKGKKYEKQSWLNGLNKKDRIASVLSILWIVIVILFVICYNGDELGGSLEHFLWWGILPVFLYWGSSLLDQKMVIIPNSRNFLKIFNKCVAEIIFWFKSPQGGI